MIYLTAFAVLVIGAALVDGRRLLSAVVGVIDRWFGGGG